MNKNIIGLLAMKSMFLKGGRKDVSTKKNVETCPNCGTKHKSNKHIFCSKKCAKEKGVI